MAKITINPVSGSYASVTAFNARMQQIEDAFNNNTLWREGFVGEPNQMEVALDMNSKAILNLPEPATATSPVRLQELTDLGIISSITDSVTVASKAVAVALTPTAGQSLYILSEDGRGNTWQAIVGAAPGTYSDNGGAFCGTVFIPTGGDGSTAWVRDYSGPVNVLWFGADVTGSSDSTTAFTISKVVSPYLEIPAGTFILDDYRLTNGETWKTAGYAETRIQQGSTGNPAINCTSDITVGQLSGISLTGFTVLGKAAATVTAVLVAADGIYAVWRCVFDFVATNTFRALEIQGPDASNVFTSSFKVNSNGTSDDAVLINGAVYNDYELFLTQCSTYALNSSQTSARFNQLTTGGPIRVTDQNSIFISPTVENISSFVGTIANVFYDGGFNNEYVQPRVVMSTDSAAKVTGTVFRAFSDTIYRQPRINMLGTAVDSPFSSTGLPFVIEGSGQNGCTNKLNTIYTDGNDSSLNLRSVSFIGDCSEWIDNNGPKGGKNIQYSAPTNNFNITVKNNTDCVILEPNADGYFANINTPYFPVDGQLITLTSTRIISPLNVAAGKVGDIITNWPSVIYPDKPVSLIYNLANQKWFLAEEGLITETQTNLIAIGNSINTTGKYAGRQVWDSTNLQPVWASGTTAGSVWVDGAGLTVHTPV